VDDVPVAELGGQLVLERLHRVDHRLDITVAVDFGLDRCRIGGLAVARGRRVGRLGRGRLVKGHVAVRGRFDLVGGPVLGHGSFSSGIAGGRETCGHGRRP